MLVSMCISHLLFTNRSSNPKVFCKEGVFRYFAKFTEKHLCQVLFFNKVVGLWLQLYLKRESDTGVFLWIFAKFLRTPFFTEQFWWLLLYKFVSMSWLFLRSVWFDGISALTIFQNQYFQTVHSGLYVIF